MTAERTVPRLVDATVAQMAHRWVGRMVARKVWRRVGMWVEC